MGWQKVDPEPPPHRCDALPDPYIRASGYRRGDVVECDGCGARYQVAEVSQHGETWLQWTRIPARGE